MIFQNTKGIISCLSLIKNFRGAAWVFRIKSKCSSMVKALCSQFLKVLCPLPTKHWQLPRLALSDHCKFTDSDAFTSSPSLPLHLHCAVWPLLVSILSLPAIQRNFLTLSSPPLTLILKPSLGFPMHQRQELQNQTHGYSWLFTCLSRCRQKPCLWRGCWEHWHLLGAAERCRPPDWESTFY